MATVRPFRSLSPSPARAHLVAAPPYDVINTREARALAAGNPDSFLHVSRPEIDLPEGVDEHSPEVYAQGAKALRDFVSRGVLLESPAPQFAMYRQQMGAHRQTGLVACVSVNEYERDVIKKHEKTRPDKEDDRTLHIDTLGAHDEPVFLTYRAEGDLEALLAEASSGPPESHFTTPDGVTHSVWTVAAALGKRIEDRFEAVRALYVADGHHRSAAAARVYQNRGRGTGEHERFLAVVFPHDQLQILAYNRLVRDAQGRTSDALLQALQARFTLEPFDRSAPPEPRSFGVFLGGQWHLARVKTAPHAGEDPVGALDCSIVQDQVLSGIFGITDPRTDKRVDFVGGIRGPEELERRVAAEGWSLALHLHPTRIEQLLAVSDAGLLMPPKSTWFEPKLRSGLHVHRF